MVFVMVKFKAKSFERFKFELFDSKMPNSKMPLSNSIQQFHAHNLTIFSIPLKSDFKVVID